MFERNRDTGEILSMPEVFDCEVLVNISSCVTTLKPD